MSVSNTPGGPEFAALCCLVSRAIGGAGAPLPAVMPEPRRLLEAAVRHRCLPLLAAGSGVAADAEMRRVLSTSTARAHFLANRLSALFREFGREGIRALAFKGPAMSLDLYGQVDMRPSDDLDIWVHPRDFAAAGRLLEAGGFIPRIVLSPVEAEAHRRAGWDRSYRSAEGDYVVELCTGVAPRYFVRPPDADCLWERSREVMLGGVPVRVPAPDALLELLCLHGTKHGWSRLLWVADVAALLRRHQLDGGALDEAFRGHGTSGMVVLGTSLAHRLLGAEVPRGSVQAAVMEQTLRYLSGDAPLGAGGPEWRYHLAVRERWRDRIRYVLLALLTPGYGDWRAVRLPPGLFWIHWLVRPVRRLLRLDTGATPRG